MTSHQKVKYVLGVETSCDDTAIGIIDSSKNIKANIVLNQNNYHKEFGGIVPEIAARAHLSFIDIALKKALTRAEIKLEEIIENYDIYVDKTKSYRFNSTKMCEDYLNFFNEYQIKKSEILSRRDFSKSENKFLLN